MDPLTEFLELAGWPRTLEEIGRERLLDLWRFASQQSEGFRAAVFGELKSLLESAGTGEWEEKDWMEVAEAMQGATVEERASLVEVMRSRLVSSRSELLERLIKALDPPCDFRSEPQCETSAMTSELNVTAEGAIAGAGPKNKRKLELEADEEDGPEPEGPHKVLILEHTLDRILSFMDARTLKTARLVCKDWNDRILANFHKGHLRIRTKRIPMGNMISSLLSVDQRMLTRLFIPRIEEIQMDTYLGEVLRHLKTSPDLVMLRSLEIEEMDESVLNYFIEVINQGELQSVVDLRLTIGFKDEAETLTKRKSSYKLVAPGTLSSLCHLSLSVHTNNLPKSRQKTTDLLVTVRSFVAAAKSLKSVTTNLLLDLSKRPVQNLDLMQDSKTLDDMNTFPMIFAIADRLRSLSVGSCFRLLLPAHPEQSFLNFGETMPWSFAPNNLEAFPKLRRLTAPFYCSFWEDFPCLDQLDEITLIRVPLPSYKLSAIVKPLGVLLNMGNVRLTLLFTAEITTSELQLLLDSVRLEEKEEEKALGVLEFKNVLIDHKVKKEMEISERIIHDFSLILEKVGRKWKRIILLRFQFVISRGPSWTEKDVPLFGGTRIGRIKLSAQCEFIVTVTLEIMD